MSSRGAEYQLLHNGAYARTDITLGSGSFGKVFVVRRVQDDLELAIKAVDKTQLTERELSKCEEEGEILAICPHPYIVQCVDIFQEGNFLNIVMELCQTDLGKYISQRRGDPLPQELVLRWTHEITLALEYLHYKKLIHRDIKKENILITEQNVCKLGDFGLASAVEEGGTFDPNTRQGTWYYLAPELLEDGPNFTEKSDMWAFGCVLFNMCTFKHPVGSVSLRNTLNSLRKCTQTSRISTELYGRDLQQIIDELLEHDLSSRLSSYELLQKPLLKAIQNSFEKKIPEDQWKRLNYKPLIVSMKYCTRRSNNCQLVWIKMLQCEGNARINLSSLSIVSSNDSTLLINLFCKRVNNTLQICGTCENQEMMDTPSLKISLKVIFSMRNKFGVDLVWSQLQNVVLNTECKEGITLMKFHEIPWRELLEDSSPRVDVTVDENVNYSYHGLSIISLPFNVRHRTNWNILKSKWNYQHEWSKMQRNEPDARLHFPPFSSQNESFKIIHLFFVRCGDNFILAGGHRALEGDTESPMTVSMRIRLFCTNRHGQNQTWTRIETVTIEKISDSGWYSMAEFHDIPWTELTDDIAPSADITFHESDSLCFLS